VLSAWRLVQSDAGGDPLKKIPFALELVRCALGTLHLEMQRSSSSE